MPSDLVVRNARISSEGEDLVDIVIRSGTIDHIGEGPSSPGHELDAGGAVVTPGGVDPHCHMAQISSTGVPTADDLFSGTTSALHGGTTTIAAFAVQHRGDKVRDVVSAMIGRVGAEAVTDVALHLILTEWSKTIEDDLDWVVDQGITSLKIFSTYDKLRLAPDSVIDAVTAASARGMTVMIHAEDDRMITTGRSHAIDANIRDARGHQLSHTREAERAGVAEALSVGERTGVPMYLVHISTEGSLDEIRLARSRGVAATVETCPHYLYLDEELLNGELTTTAAYMSSPPLRGQADRAALWAGLASGEIDIVASDHAPYRMDGGKLPRGSETVFTEVANGMPGVEMRMPLMMSAFVDGRLPLQRVLDLCCQVPAESLGVAPRKGTLDVGSEADLVIWDLGATRVVDHADLHDAVDYTPYEGLTVSAWPDTVVRAGQIVGPDLARGSGRFVGRTTT